MYSEEFTDVQPEYKFPRALSVSEINDFIKRIFDLTPQFTDIYVHGEISNFKNHYGTGHLYFTLKDEASAIRCVMFRSSAVRLKFAPENGTKVTVHGRISAYPRDGQYQIYCDSMEPSGIGALYKAYEQLKKKLSEEGLFDESHKKKIPAFPSSVGVITSATGAAVRDIVNVTSRRYPPAEILIYPATVQGKEAAPSVIRALTYFNKVRPVDVIIVGRGGGSIEDLWAFNDEALARAVFASEIPVISAVGHETDFTICDFVADLRAPTPSAAAELAVPDIEELKGRIASYFARSDIAVRSKIESYRQSVEHFKSSRVLTDPMAFIEDRILQLGTLSDRLAVALNKTLDDKTSRLSLASGMLNTLSPLSVLSRGYGVVTSGDGNIVKSVKNVKAGDKITVSLADGDVKADVTDITKGGKYGKK